MIVTSHTLPGKDRLAGLTFTLKRYRPLDADSPPLPGVCSVALLLAHSVGTHKETWEPVIEYLFHLQSSDSGVTISEVWSVDSPNHGEAAAFNEKSLLERPHGISGHDWGCGIQTILESNLIPRTNLVPIGHSGGACVMTLSTLAYGLDDLPYSSMILVEPTMMTREHFEQSSDKASELKRVRAAVYRRKDIWASRDLARAWLQLRHPWKRWEASALDSLVKYGLRDLPTAAYPDHADGVTLSCTREQETAGYMYDQDGVDANERLREVCARIPVHCIFGAELDLVPDEIHRGICDAGRKASITRIPGAGHLVTQEKPYQLAQAVWTALRRDYGIIVHKL